LPTCYEETGVTDFGLYAQPTACSLAGRKTAMKCRTARKQNTRSYAQATYRPFTRH